MPVRRPRIGNGSQFVLGEASGYSGVHHPQVVARQWVRVTLVRPGGRRVASAQHRQALGDELRRDDQRDRGELLTQALGGLQRTARPDRDDRRAGRGELLFQSVHIARERAARVEDECREPQRCGAGAVAQIGGAEALGPETGDLLELQGRLEGRRVGVAREMQTAASARAAPRGGLDERAGQRHRRLERCGEVLQPQRQVARAERARELGDHRERGRERLRGGHRPLLAGRGDERMLDGRREREPASFVSAAASAPRPAANSSAATISGVSPDCETPSTSALDRSTGGRYVVYSEGAARLAESSQRASSR